MTSRARTSVDFRLARLLWTCTPVRPDQSGERGHKPLLEVRKGDCEVRDAQNIADILVDPEGALERRNHWEKTSHSCCWGDSHVLDAEADKTLAGVADFLSDPSRPIEATLNAMLGTRISVSGFIPWSHLRHASFSTKAKMSAQAYYRPR